MGKVWAWATEAWHALHFATQKSRPLNSISDDEIGNMSKKKTRTLALIKAMQGLFGLIVMPAVPTRRRKRGRPRKSPPVTVGLPPALNDTMIFAGVTAYTAARRHNLAPEAAVELIYEALCYSASHLPINDGKRGQKPIREGYQLWSMPHITTSMIQEGGRAYRQIVHDKLAPESAIKQIYDALYRAAQA
jgi:hypothetical protein